MLSKGIPEENRQNCRRHLQTLPRRRSVARIRLRHFGIGFLELKDLSDQNLNKNYQVLWWTQLRRLIVFQKAYTQNIYFTDRSMQRIQQTCLNASWRRRIICVWNIFFIFFKRWRSKFKMANKKVTYVRLYIGLYFHVRSRKTGQDLGRQTNIHKQTMNNSSFYFEKFA